MKDCFILNFTRPKTHAQACVVTPRKFQKYLEEAEKEKEFVVLLSSNVSRGSSGEVGIKRSKWLCFPKHRGRLLSQKHEEVIRYVYNTFLTKVLLTKENVLYSRSHGPYASNPIHLSLHSCKIFKTDRWKGCWIVLDALEFIKSQKEGEQKLVLRTQAYKSGSSHLYTFCINTFLRFSRIQSGNTENEITVSLPF